MDDDVVSQLLREKRAREQGAGPDLRSPYEPPRVPERSAPRSATAPYAPAPLSPAPSSAPIPTIAPSTPAASTPSSSAPGPATATEREATPRRPYEPPRPASGQPTAAEDELKMLIDVGGSGAAIGAALPIVTRLLKTVDWVKVLRSIEEGLRAKQERAIYRAVAITWEEFGVCSAFAVQLLRDAEKLDREVLDKVVELFKGEKPAWYFSPERKGEICRELLPKLAQIQSVLGRARRHADDGVNGEAQRDLEQLAMLLKGVRTYFAALTS